MKAYLLFGGSLGLGAAAAAIHRSWVLAEDDYIHPPGVNMGGTGMTTYNFAGATKEPSAVRPSLAMNLASMPKSSNGDVVDVTVIGGGFAGLHAALALAEKGKRVVLLEGKRIGSGASGRNGGDAVIGFHTSVDELADWTRSKEKAIELFSHSEMGYERLKKIISTYRIQCDPHEHGAVTISFASEKGAPSDEAAKKEIESVNEQFKQKLEYRDKKALEKSGIFSDRYRSGVFEPRNLALNPLELCFGLARACESTGNVVIYENSKVIGVDHDSVKGRFTVTTASGSVQSQKCILATNHAPASISPALALQSTSISTSVMLTAPLPKEKLDKCLAVNAPACFDNRFGLAYFRRVPGDRIMYGCFASGLPLRTSSGGDWLQVSRKNTAPVDKAQAALLADLQTTFPILAGDLKADRCWTGRLQARFPVFPLVGRDSSTGMFYSLAFAGHGLVPSCAAGALLASAICEGDTRYELWSQVVPWWLPAGGPQGYIGASMACALLRWWDTTRGRA